MWEVAEAKGLVKGSFRSDARVATRMYLGVHGKFTDRLGDLVDGNDCRPLRDLTRSGIVKFTMRLIQSSFKPHADDTTHPGSVTQY